MYGMPRSIQEKRDALFKALEGIYHIWHVWYLYDHIASGQGHKILKRCANLIVTPFVPAKATLTVVP